MSPYRDTIAQALTDVGFPEWADPATLALVEDCMRTNRCGLDHLSREDFAVEVYAIITDLAAHPDQTRDLCSLLGHDLPRWLDNPPTRKPRSLERTRQAILATLRHAFPATRFHLTAGHGAAHSQLVLAWTGGPAKTSVDDVLAQFLPDPDTLSTSRYSCTAIYTCRHRPIPQAG